jgi:ABC-2 type transport system ATP-binding protein
MVAPEIAPHSPVAGSGVVILRARQLTKQYGQRLAVNGLNLDVFRGDIFGFLGPNGAGKTTTIRMALGLIAPTAGTVEVLGQNIATNAAAVLPRVGALVETPALYLYMTGRDNLRAFSQSLGNVGDARVGEVLALVGLAGRQNDRVRTYSLGMKQRLGVAMALLNDPDLLMLDEPANGLDPAGIVEMRELLRSLAKQGKTIFISSHVLGEVQQLCTRVGIINLGQLVTEARPEDLTRSTGMYLVYVENAPAALAAIQAQPWGTAARLSANGAILSPTPDGRGRSLNQFLVSAGYVPDSLIYQSESLEQAFLRLTGATPGGAQ